MALEQELKVIEEDFEEAYYSRKEDLESLNDIDRKIMKMHWGGIVIECFVKYLVVEKYSMNKMRGIGEWFSNYTENLLREKEQEGQQLKKKDYENYACKLGRGHDFRNWIKEILKFDTNQINEDLDIVYEPLDKSFIDLRYEPEDSQEIEDNYEKWKEAYNRVTRWLIGHLDTLTREDYVRDTMGGD